MQVKSNTHGASRVVRFDAKRGGHSLSTENSIIHVKYMEPSTQYLMTYPNTLNEPYNMNPYDSMRHAHVDSSAPSE